MLDPYDHQGAGVGQVLASRLVACVVPRGNELFSRLFNQNPGHGPETSTWPADPVPEGGLGAMRRERTDLQ